MSISRTDWAHNFYHLIQYCDTHASNIACWCEDGDKIIIKDTSVFEEIYQIKMGSSSKWSSIVKQLNNHGFQKYNSRNSRNEPEIFAHECGFFLRGNVTCLDQIKKKKRSNTTTAERLSRFEEEIEELKEVIKQMKEEIRNSNN
mmetsp:Transcript_691/g.890  ORF Transcript_691/g.890 Transcript_691/m.890 type:complete len:144 (-) Transcript_691:233-664(-)|eukprot:CAMPEP_0185740634 /NCGR_PEP_ID=MMETSP1171-20130828/38233_1 /TAXON_ID=374046 /ORGANISM="Helicotheca tamensis, Strain CCMP826" /LENGTH=143 /DNA_ID=CAMNT_0028412529 /DNA_START=14 /DNA_END=445 /DNA_ORIENTATION=-